MYLKSVDQACRQPSEGLSRFAVSSGSSSLCVAASSRERRAGLQWRCAVLPVLLGGGERRGGQGNCLPYSTRCRDCPRTELHRGMDTVSWPNFISMATAQYRNLSRSCKELCEYTRDHCKGEKMTGPPERDPLHVLYLCGEDHRSDLGQEDWQSISQEKLFPCLESSSAPEIGDSVGACWEETLMICVGTEWLV